MEQKINISIIVPCRNEENFIGQCIDSIIAQDYPKEQLEVFVVDGMSEDKTKEIVEEYGRKHQYIRILENERKIIPTAMNIGIRNARGNIIMKFDAHTIYENNYISKCIRFLNEYKAENVGGLQVAVPRKDSLIAKGIALSLSHQFGVGNSYHRLSPSKPIWTDTAYSGCYRKEVFESIGLYDENIARSEDVAINSRIKRAGGKILLVPEIRTYYYARSDLSSFIKHNFDNGFWITYPLKFGRSIFSFRHLVPFAFVSSLSISSLLVFYSPFFKWLFLFLLSSYVVTSLYFSSRIAINKRDIKYFFLMSMIFPLLHIIYGLGSLWGVLNISVSKQFWNNLRIYLRTGKISWS